MLRVLGTLLIAVGAFSVQQAVAQTPEGTVITNTATVTFTDANGNAYAPVDGMVSITIGFSAGIDVVAHMASIAPDAPSTDNIIVFTIYNLGNGPDTVQVGWNAVNPKLFQNVRFHVSGIEYGSIDQVNAVLADVEIPSKGGLGIGLTFDVPAGVGGLTGRIEFTATSIRDNTKTDTDGIDVLPPMSGAIEVTPDGGQNLEQLPSNGTQYVATFTIDNQQTGTDSLTLVASQRGSAVITIVSVNGVMGTTADIASIASGVQQQVDVVYTIDNAAVAGAQDTLVLTVTSKTNPTVTDEGFYDITVVKPSLAITKQAFRDDTGTPIESVDRVAPGEHIWYRITVTNTGTAAAVNVSITDELPAQVSLDSTASDNGAPAWDISVNAGTVTATLPGELAPNVSRHIWIRVLIN